ncbi:MAG: nitronate monooxygenase [Candidatus Berkelbacteria bacterium]|nr:nitronate monooxygenase [Candidatus Berkelbacteria bacterium]
MFNFPTVKVLGASRPTILVQGGMGVGISLSTLAGAVARRGGVGIVSFVALDLIVGNRVGRELSYFEAAKLEIEEAIRLSNGNGLIGINCMAILHSYEDSIRGAVAGGARATFVGAGLPFSLPELVDRAREEAGITTDVAMVPIVSSVRALDLICRRWKGRLPDAVVVEGPLAGGHLGFKEADITNPAFALEEIFGPIYEFSQRNGNFPIIVAGGIWDRSDICRWIDAGAAGVQMGTRFLATFESGASEDFKKAVVAVESDGIIVAIDPGSPSGMPFRIIANSAGYLEALLRKGSICRWQYMLHNKTCKALESTNAFCICKGLLTAIGIDPDLVDHPIFTVGINAARVKEIKSVDEVIDELTGFSQ